MRREIPPAPTSLDDRSPVQDAIDLLTWSAQLLRLMMDDAAPDWYRNGGKDLDLEDVYRLRFAHAQIHLCIPKLRAIENAAPCQEAALSETVQPAQPQMKA